MTENTAVEQVPYHYLTPADTQPVAPTVPAPAVPVQTTPVVESPLVPVSDKRVDKLAQAREQKIDILGTRTGYAETDRRSNTFVNTEDGYRESTQNKVTNDFTDYELDYLGKELNNRFGVVKTPEGLFRQDSKGNRTPYEGDPNDLMSYYEFATKDGKIKRGTWGGDDPRDRYSEAYLKSKNKNDFVGAEGVDVNQLLTHYYMPREVVKEYEALRHGSTEAMKNRAVRQSVDKARLPEYQAAKQRIGSGMTEVYNRAESLQPDNFNGADLWARANAKYQLAPRTPEEQAEYDERISKELLADAKRKSTADYLARGLSSSGAPDTVLNRTGNTAAAFGSSFTRGLVLDSGAAIGDLIGLDESTIGTPESRRAYADEMFGYDANYSQATMKRVSERVASMYDKKELDMGDMLDITTDVFSTPEILADSLGMIAGLAVGFGKFTKVGKAISGVEKEYRIGKLSKPEAKAEIQRIKSTHTLVEKASKLAAANVGYGATVAGMTENAVHEFAKNNEGNVDGLDVLRIGAFSAAIASVDRFASKIALNDIPGIRSLNMFSPESTRALRDVVSEMPADVYARTASSVAKVLGGTAKLAGVAGLEGLTEYSQTMAEIFSHKYATEKYGDDFGVLFADRANQIESLTGAAVGVAMGGQMHSMNLVAQGAQSALVNGLPVTLNTANTQESDLAPEAQQELENDYQTYTQTFNRLIDQLQGGQLTPATLPEHLLDLEELKRTRSAAEKKVAPDKLASADTVLVKIQDEIAAMVMSHPDGNLPLTRGTSTVVSEMEAVSAPSTEQVSTLPRQQVGTNPDSFTNVNAQASRDLSDTLGLTSLIEEEFAQGKTAKQVESALANQLKTMPQEDRTDFIVQVRATLGIPSQSTQEGKAEFAQWLSSRNQSTSGQSNQSESTTLGSRPLSETEQRALAETAIDIIAARKGESITDEEVLKLNNFGSANGVDTARIERIIKSHASVENEATIEERGVLGRERALDLMLGSGTVSKKQVQKSYDQTAQWLSTSLSSIEQLEEGIREAEEKATTANNSARKGVKVKPVYTQYRKFAADGQKPQYFDIEIKYDGNKYTADITQALRLISDKKRTVVGLNNLLKKYHKEAAEYLDSGSTLTGGGYTIPKGPKKVDATENEINYIKNVSEVLQSIPEAGTVINRVVLGEEPAGYWSAKGERGRANSSITNIHTTNKGEYSSSDVVYLHTGSTYKPKGATENTTLTELYKTKTNPAAKEIAKAMEARATLVVDGQYGRKTPAGIAIAAFMAAKGYVPAGAVNDGNGVASNIYVPDTEANARRLAESQERASEALQKVADNKALAEAKEVRQQRLIDLAIEEAASSLPENAGRTAETVQTDITSAMETVREDFLPLAKRQVEESLKEGEVLTDEAVNEQLTKNIRTFMKNGTTKAVRKLREIMERDGLSLSDFDELDPSLKRLVEADIQSVVDVENEAELLMEAWKKAKSSHLEGKYLVNALNTALEPVGKTVGLDVESTSTFKLKSIGQSIIDNSVGSTTNIKTYAVEVEPTKGKVRTSYVKYPLFSLEAYPTGKTFNDKGVEVKVKNVNEVLNNPTQYVKVAKDTPLNTIPVSNMPEVFDRVAQKVIKAFKTLPELNPLEINIPEGTKEDIKVVSALLESPARSLLMDVEGNLNPNAAASIGIAIADLLKTDQLKLTLGYKDTTTIANMFSVTEAEVTNEMREIANKHGSFAKSVVNTLGSSVMSALGMKPVKTNEINRGQYERLVTDVGNIALQLAEELGVLKTTSEGSNVLSKLFKDGEVLSIDPVTWFVHVPAKRVKNDTGAKVTALNKAATVLGKDYELIEGFLPDVVNSVKAPYFTDGIPEDVKQAALSTIRNDLVGGQIPAEAKEALKNFMETPFEMDMDNTGKFLAELEDENTKKAIYKTLGYIDLNENDADYQALTFADKEIQEAINRGIEKSVEQLRKYYTEISNGLENTMYFTFYYTGNHRYMMNSNTLNGQADKLHRFFIRPKAHAVTYYVDRSNNTFKHTYTEKGESKTIDTSLYVRTALVQGAGVKDGVDKTSTAEIIRLGNILLSMSAEDAVHARNELVNTGKFTVVTDTGVEHFEPDHLSHGLQSLEFIRKYKSDMSDTFTDGLTAEFDALTSGFSNKVQQFGTISDITEHKRRVGIIDKTNPAADLLSDSGLGINDLLSGKLRKEKFTDSYQNLGQDTVSSLNTYVETLEDKPKALFEVLTPLLPGADQRTKDRLNIDVSSALRKLFKPAFMIFNYSAGINRIVTNLGEAITASIFTEIAKADISTLPTEKLAAFKSLAAMVKDTKNGKKGITVVELQRRIREESTSYLTIDSLGYNNAKGKSAETQTLESYLINSVIKPTYGKSVQNSFEKNFSEFIVIQDATNDAFKSSFALFGHLLEEKVKTHRQETDSAPISEAALLEMIKSLKDAFPVIAGPLSQSLEEGVHVYTTDTKTAHGTLATTTSPVIHFNRDGKATTRKMNPIIKTIIAAVNSGAVLPFHALDGAQLARTVNLFVSSYLQGSDTKSQGAGILPLHDAFMGPLPFADIIGFLYNKSTVDLNRTYSVIDEINKMVVRAQSIIEGKHPTLKVDVSKVSAVNSLSFVKSKDVDENKKIIEELTKKKKELTEANAEPYLLAQTKVDLEIAKGKYSFGESFKTVAATLKLWVVQVNQQREEMYEDGTRVGVMVTTPGGVYSVGSEEVDLTYLSKLHDLYETVSVNVAPVVEEKEVRKTSGAPESLQARVSISNAVFYAIPPQLRKIQEYVDSSAGMLLLKDLLIKPTSVITVVVNDKVVRSEDSALSEAELHAVDLAWSQTVLVGNTALRKGATLVFSQEAVTTQDLGDSSVIGESYVFHRITESGDCAVTPEVVDGVTVYKVSKSTPEDTVTLIDDTQDVTIPELDKVTNKNGHKNTTNNFKKLAKRCK